MWIFIAEICTFVRGFYCISIIVQLFLVTILAQIIFVNPPPINRLKRGCRVPYWNIFSVCSCIHIAWFQTIYFGLLSLYFTCIALAKCRSSSGSSPFVPSSIRNTLGMPICAICNSKSVQSSIFKLCIFYCSHIEYVHLLFCQHFTNILGGC